jgi:hypothetical protein
MGYAPGVQYNIFENNEDPKEGYDLYAWEVEKVEALLPDNLRGHNAFYTVENLKSLKLAKQEAHRHWNTEGRLLAKMKAEIERLKAHIAELQAARAH